MRPQVLDTTRVSAVCSVRTGSNLRFDPFPIYKYQDGLAYYESTRDVASHFFIDYLPKGTYVFEYSTRVQLRGQYQTGVAQIQCMYAPEFNSHSQSLPLTVKWEQHRAKPHYGAELSASAKAKAELLIAEALRSEGVTAEQIASRRNSHPFKVGDIITDTLTALAGQYALRIWHSH